MKPARMHPPIHAALWLVFALLLVPASRVPTAFAATRVFSDADKGATVQLKVGDVVELHLQSNPSTGFAWYVHPQSTHLLKIIGQSQTESTEPGVGRPVIQIFKFQAVKTGDGVLLLHYVRSWEKPSADEQQFDLHVSIR